jgi:hypothetical protein
MSRWPVCIRLVADDEYHHDSQMQSAPFSVVHYISWIESIVKADMMEPSNLESNVKADMMEPLESNVDRSIPFVPRVYLTPSRMKLIKRRGQRDVCQFDDILQQLSGYMDVLLLQRNRYNGLAEGFASRIIANQINAIVEDISRVNAVSFDDLCSRAHREIKHTARCMDYYIAKRELVLNDIKLLEKGPAEYVRTSTQYDRLGYRRREQEMDLYTMIFEYHPVYPSPNFYPVLTVDERLCEYDDFRNYVPCDMWCMCMNCTGLCTSERCGSGCDNTCDECVSYRDYRALESYILRR